MSQAASQAIGYGLLPFYLAGAALVYLVIRRRAPELLRRPDMKRLVGTCLTLSWLTLLVFVVAFAFDWGYQRVMVRAEL